MDRYIPWQDCIRRMQIKPKSNWIIPTFHTHNSMVNSSLTNYPPYDHEYNDDLIYHLMGCELYSSHTSFEVESGLMYCKKCLRT